MTQRHVDHHLKVAAQRRLAREQRIRDAQVARMVLEKQALADEQQRAEQAGITEGRQS